MEIKAGTELEAPNGRRYRLLAYLGGGKYSEVWQAHVVGESERQVAVKIMASALDEKERRVFVREAERLLSLASAEEARGLRVDGHSLVPAIETIADEFFVETLAPGKPLDQILREQGRLPEPEALTIAEQLCRVFQALHEGLQRSYLDFQPRNVFWDYRVRRIMVVDWNLLGPEGEADAAGDLEAIARLFYRLAVGESFSLGHLDEPSGWRTLASGTRDILTRALHPNQARRYSSAAALREDLAEQLSWWASEANDLLQEAAQCLEVAVRERTECFYWQARHILDIAERKGTEWSLIERLRERAAAGLRCSQPYLRQGTASLRVGDIVAAEVAFASGFEEAVSLPGKLFFLRWMEIVKKAPRSDVDEVVQVIETLATWTEAEWEGRPWIDRPAAGPESGWPDFLGKEWRAWQSLAQVKTQPPQDKDEVGYRRAAGNYREVLSIAHALSYGELLLSLWGDLEGQAQNWEALADVLRRKREQVEDLEQTFQKNREEALHYLQEALQRNKEREDLTHLALSWARQLFEGGSFSEAKHLLCQIANEACPSLLGKIMSLRQEAEEALLWEHRLERAKEAFSELQGEDLCSNYNWEELVKDAVEEAWRETPEGKRLPLKPLIESLYCRLGRADQEAKWGYIILILEDIAEQAVDVALLRSRGWNLFRQVFASPGLPNSLLPRLERIGSGLAPDEEAWIAFREETERIKGAQITRMQIERHWRWAEEAASLGLVSRLPDAIGQLEQALRLAEELGDQRLSNELETLQQEYIKESQEIYQRFQWSKELAKKQDWSGIIRFLDQIQERFGISGWDRPGEIEEWLTELRFKEKAAFFRETSNRWWVAEPEEKKELLRRMEVTLGELRRLASRLDKGTKIRLNEFEEQYQIYYSQLFPAPQALTELS